jgi:O-acetyl-ADP-ribose deacetylase (regulator of RNase III)
VARLEFRRGDLTAQPDIDGIVNAANEQLAAGAGVCGAIRRAGGAAVFEEAAGLGGCATGDAKATGAGDLPNRYVVHAVGPVYSGTPRDADLLASCHRRAVEEAARLGCRSIAFPAISTGIYGYPVAEAAPVAVAAARDAAAACDLDLVRFVLFSESDLAAFEAAAASER